MEEIRKNWTMDALKTLYSKPLIELICQANRIHMRYHRLGEIQVCHLISVKTGGCPEDCKYCAQSSHYKTNVTAQPLMSYEEVLSRAKESIKTGVTRICLGAAWREVRDNKQFDEILRMVKGISELGVEVCCTLGMLKESQAQRLKEAGLYAYNHNLDTSEKYYKSVATTRTYQDRLNTLDIVRKSGLSVCCGGIFGIGETPLDRLELLHTLSQRDPHPESVPINHLARVPGTPFEHSAKVPIWESLRIIAVARIVIPKCMLRLSAGRVEMTFQEQMLCFLAGANSIFAGEKLLTVGNPSIDLDEKMFELFGLTKRESYV